MENTKSKFNHSYFNKIAITNLFLILIVFAFIDFSLWADDVIELISIRFYLKLIICLFYFFLSKSQEVSVGEIISRDVSSFDLAAPFHFSVLYISLWLGGVSLYSSELFTSVYIGLFLIVGGGAAFSFIHELIKIITPSNIFMMLLEKILRVLVFSFFIFALYFFINGELVWQILPFYEWSIFR